MRHLEGELSGREHDALVEQQITNSRRAAGLSIR